MVYRTVGIIGAGPSGIAAGVQLTRYGVSTVVFEGAAVGGLLRNANWVENYAGFPNGIKGIELANRMEQQLRTIGVELIAQHVRQVKWDGKQFRLATSSQELCCEVLIIASGTKPRPFCDAYIEEGARERIFYHVVDMNCPPTAKIAIVGAGDAAFDYALNLAVDHQVEIFNRTDTRRCLPLLWERAKDHSAIRYTPWVQVQRVELGRQNQLQLSLSCAGGREERVVDALLIAIGRDPCLDFLDPEFALQLEALEASGRCYRIGDVKNGMFRQTAIAVGDGLRAAMEIYQKLTEVCS